MKFHKVLNELPDVNILSEEYKNSREIGVMRIGQDHLFFRAGLRTYAINYSDVKNCFRRVQEVPAKMCCGKGNFQIESIVISDGVKELAQIQMPGTKASKAAFEELKNKMPSADFSAPKRESEA